MCGIAGVLGVDARCSEERVAEMVAKLRHRGPDGSGIFGDREAILGHCRLAIVGLGEAGCQPMTSRDGRWTITFNGEIFNFIEMRSQLRGDFRRDFRSNTDTEVLLEACAAWGVEEALRRAAGMFAFAIWDRHERELTLARDRLGEKPLVYFWDGKILAFASELKALDGFHNRELNPGAVDTYLGLGYVPAPEAIFRHCRKLSPGHLLRLRAGDSPRPQRWWFPAETPAEAYGSVADRRARLRQQVSQAVEQRLRADVPIALGLSGGVDSSVIAAECVRQGAHPDAFTVRFGADTAPDVGTDAWYARQVARHLGLRHHVIDGGALETPAAMEELVGRMVAHYDEPLADSSALPTLALARCVAGSYKVILDGDGGDEAFGGYKHYQYVAAKQAVKAVAAAAGLCDGRGGGWSGVYVESKAVFRARQRAQLLNGHGVGNCLPQTLRHRAAQAATGSALQRALATDRELPLANGLNYKMDIALGAFGMEGRAPFLDHRVVEWAQHLPARDLVRGRQKKVLLRAAYAEDFPKGLLDRPKQGFGAPIGAWLAGPLRGLVTDCLPCPLLDHGGNAGWDGQRLWTLVLFAAWARHWRATW